MYIPSGSSTHELYATVTIDERDIDVCYVETYEHDTNASIPESLELEYADTGEPVPDEVYNQDVDGQPLWAWVIDNANFEEDVVEVPW